MYSDIFSKSGFNVERKSNDRAIKFRIEGNKEYRKGNFLNALHKYNESLCDAEKELDVALAYGNRSAVYFELELYKECIQNIEIAINLQYPSAKLTQLIERKDKCIKQRKLFGDVDPSSEVKNFIKLSHPQNPTIPFISNFVEIKRDNIFGRGLYATENLKPGDIIAIEPPLINVLYDTGRYIHCCNCLSINNFNLFPCLFSSTLMFCSHDCRNLVYGALGDKLSVILKYKQLYYVDLLRYLFEFSKLGLIKYCETAWQLREDKTIFDFNYSKEKSKKYALNLAKCIFSLKCLKKYKNAKSYIEFYTGIMNLNDITLEMYCQRSDGVVWDEQASSLCLFASFFNHSCDPNVKRFPVENKIGFYVCKPVMKGEQLFITYGPNFVNETLKERREEAKKYEFTCQCEACTKNYPTFKKYKYTEYPSTESLTIEAAISEYKRNNETIANEFSSYPNSKICTLIERNNDLIHLIASIFMLPLKVKNNNDEKLNVEIFKESPSLSPYILKIITWLILAYILKYLFW